MKNFSANTLSLSMKYLAIFVIAMLIFSMNSMANAVDTSNLLKSSDNAIKAISKHKIEKSAWYPQYHLASTGYIMKNPAAFALFKNEYHLFYENEIKFADGNKTVWGHFSSPDLVNWQTQKTALSPSEAYDKDGIISGSAITEGDTLYLIYTANTTETNGNKHQTQNLAMSNDGLNFAKSANNPVIKMAPHYSSLKFSSQNFNNPYVWKIEDRYYAIIGTKYEQTNDGAVLLFKSKDLRNWVFINVTALGQKGEMGSTWETPALLHVSGNDLLSITTAGIKPHEKKYLNKYNSGAFIGKLDYNTGRFSQKSAFMLFDHGFDFYAPQFITTTDGRHIFIGRLSMEGNPNPESSDHWAGMMSLPRELTISNGKIITMPIKELNTLRNEKYELKEQTIKSEKEYSNIKGDVFEMEIVADMTNAKSFSIKLRASDTQETLLSYDKNTKMLKLNRDKSGKAFKGEREAVLPLMDNNKIKLRIFVDKSSIEIFANDGELAMSSRIYPDKGSNDIRFSSEGETKIESLNFYKLKSIHN